MTRDKNPGKTPFAFLHDKSSAGYKYYSAKLIGFEAIQKLAGKVGLVPPPPSTAASSNVPPPSRLINDPTVAAVESYAMAMERRDPPLENDKKRFRDAYGNNDDDDDGPNGRFKESSSSGSSTSASWSNYTLNETSFDRRKTFAVFKEDGSRGHHMSDYIPKEELARFLIKTGDEAAKKQAEVMVASTSIKADNVGYKLLQKMGWKEGEGAGTSRSGITAPIAAGGGDNNNLGIGAVAQGDVSANDDIYTQYRKRMQLGYKHRPNPLGNPRKQYY